MPRKEYNERGTATQPVLPIFDVPKVVRAHGLRDAHSRPLAAAGKGRGGFRPRRVSTSEAWRWFASIEVRTGNSYPAILLDCDEHDGTAALVEAIAGGQAASPELDGLPCHLGRHTRGVVPGPASASRRPGTGASVAAAGASV